MHGKHHELLTERDGQMIEGLILILLGGFFLLQESGVISFSFGLVWPFFLLIPGFFLVLRYSKRD